MVVSQQSDTRGVDRLFHALSDATRRDIVARVLHEPQSVSGLARRYPMSFAAVQRHVAVLEEAGLVRKERRGREQVVTGEAEAIRRVHALLDALEARWRSRIDLIGELLAEPTKEEAP